MKKSKRREEYGFYEEINLVRYYRTQGHEAPGTAKARAWYLMGIKVALKGDEYDQRNYAYYYDCQKHYQPYERKGLAYFEKAAQCFRRSAELGNDLAMMNYSLYLLTFKDKKRAGINWLIRASKAGLAVADYQIAILLKNGYYGLEKNEEKAERYLARYKKRCEESERQLFLAWDLCGDRYPIGRSYMFSWFCGYSFPERYDTPHARPSKWKYGDD